jgi:hypothetical protein
MAKPEQTNNYTTVLETVLMEMSAKNPEIAVAHIQGRLSAISEEALLLKRILKKIAPRREESAPAPEETDVVNPSC